ncbi:MAG: PilW family protein [Oceanospirillaceae bacterium]|nr:PilW family protein [Oceanospirillaceae bacterium]
MRNKESGFSLIELMIAMTLSLVLIAMILSVFINSINNQQIRNAIGSLQENSRFASHFFSRDFRSLGFWGCLEGGEAEVNVVSKAGGAIGDQLNTLQGSLLATDGVSDTIEILTILDQSFPLSANMASISSDISITGSTFEVDDEVLIGDCNRADIFTISKKTGNLFEHKSTKNLSNDLSYPYNENAKTYPIVKITYHIITDADGSKSLFRKLNNEAGDGIELISDVEDMQVLYGLADADGNLTGYTPESDINAADFSDVISVRISLLLSSAEVLSEPVGYRFNGTNVMPTDKKMRRVFNATYTLRNRIN